MFKQHKPKIIAIIVIAIISIAVFSYVNYLMGIPLDIEIPKEFVFNGTKIALAWTDDNTNETLIIQSDKKEYNGFNSVDVYFSITNINKRDQDMDVVVWLPSEKAKVNKVERISEDGSNFEFPILNFEINSNFEFRNRKDVGGSDNGYSINDQIESGETNYYKATIKYPFKSKGEFFIEAFGGGTEAKPLRFALANRRGLASSAYGHLDPWYSSDWSYKREITINASQIATTTSAFPVLAATTLADLKTTTHGGKVGNDNGYDIVFVDDDDSTILNYEREKYASTTGEIAYWIKTDISSTVDKTIYMYYGNASASDQATTTGVWDSSYKGVWHMNQDPSSASTTDSTINSNNGTSGGSMASDDLVNGNIGKAIDFDGADDLVNCGKNSSLNNMGPLTWQAWIYPRSRGEGIDDLPAGRIIDKAQKRFAVEDTSGSSRELVFASSGGSLIYRMSTNNIFSYNNWYHVTVTWDGSGTYTNINHYVNGANESAGGSSGSSPNDDSSNDLIIGNLIDGTRTFDGIIDEVRVSNIVRSAGWIETEYNNQGDVGSFITIGTEVNSNTIILSDHTAGQEADSFTNSGGETDAELFAFKFANTGENINVQQAVFNLSETAGLTNGDWSGVEIIEDTNNNGTIDAGETTSVGGTGSVDMAGGTITFSSQFTVSAATNYILRADFASLSGGDKATISLTVGNITAVGAASAESSTSTGSAESATHIETAPSWYSSNWSYKRQITINSSQIATTTDAFPVLVATTLADLKTTINGGKVGNDNGYDIIFVDDDDSTILNYEREKYASTTGEIAYWIKTDISSTVDKTIYMYYGNSGASDVSTTTGVWDDNFVMVQHMQETPAGTTYDSTSNNNDGTTYNMDSADQVAGQIDGSLDFDGTGDYVKFLPGVLPSGDNNFSLSLWGNIPSSPNPTTGAFFGQSDIKFIFYAYHAASGGKIRLFSAAEAFVGPDIRGTGQRHILVTKEGTTYSLYVDGVINTSGTGTNLVDSIDSYLGMRDGGASYPFNGLIDEVRISNVARTAGWIATEYNNQSDVDTFLTISSEEALGTLVLADNTAGQEADAFTYDGGTTDLELFAFKLTNANENITVSNLEFTLSGASGLADSDWSEVEIMVDTNNDGTIGASETTSVGGAGAVSISGNTIIFSTAFTASAATNYILRADFASLSTGDQVTIDLTAGNITAEGVSTGATITPTGSATQVSHSKTCYSSDYSYKRTITLDANQIATTTSAFPILATSTEDYLKTTTHSGKIESDDGYDIIFVKNDDTTLMDFEIEKYASSTGELVAWINTGISSTTDTTFYMYYGNSGASDVSTTTGVWDDNFVMVQHLQETPAGTTYDSTQYDNDGTTYNMDSADQVAGQIDGSLDFDGGDDYVDVGTGLGNSVSTYTVTGWFKPDNAASSGTIFSSKDSGWKLIFRVESNTLKAYHITTHPTFIVLTSLDSSVNNSIYYRGDVTWDGTTVKLYLDGSEVDSDSANVSQDWSGGANIGRQVKDLGEFFNGIIDEVRISNVARTAGWIATEYNNQSDVGSFLTIGAETSKNPVVTTNTVTKIASTIATANGNITNIGSGIVTTRGFKYGLTETDTWSVSEAGSFNANVYKLDIPSLTPGTTYYIRAFATNSEGTSYGSYVSFITLSNQTGSPIIFKRNVILKENMILK